MRILIVDDEFVSRKKAEKLLSSLGECEFATSGKEGVEAVMQAYDRGDPYDLVTMDVMMPEVDGLQAVKIIREKEAERNIPYGKGVKILMLTASDQIRTVFASYFEGCESYVVKPFNKEKLLSAMNELGFPTDTLQPM